MNGFSLGLATRPQSILHIQIDILPILFCFIIGSFVVQRQRPPEPLAYIHSKPVNYTNNGGGRDTYISDSAGGLKQIYQPAYQKRTFYNNLRQYP
jgi:hypothetical protein